MMSGTLNIQSLRSFIQTRKDANDVQQLFSNLSNQLFNESMSADEIFARQLPHNQYEALQKLALDNGVNFQDKNQVREFLLSVKEIVQILPVIHIMLAYEPKKELLDSILEWFRTNIRQPVILDIVVDEALIAGSIISFNGKVSDHSINSEVLKLHLDDEN